MKTIHCVALSLSLLALNACARKPQVSPEVAEALAFAAELEKRLGASFGPAGNAGAFVEQVGGMFQPSPGQRSPDTLDPTTLVTEADVSAALRSVRAAGGEPSGYEVRIEKVLDEFARFGGRGKTGCKIGWNSVSRDGSIGASGTIEVVVLGMPVFKIMRNAGSEPLPALGEDGFVLEGTPYVRIGDLGLTIGSTSGSLDLSVEVLRRAAARAGK